ncbi:MAG: F0F1 ATP synthase subunit delta [Legionella sp.]|jgi:F-type H+-transporting ATPase subunit delta
MSDSTTVARPYAKALFEHALATKKLSEWSGYLSNLAQAVSLPEAKYFLENPAVTTEQQIELLSSVHAAKTKVDEHLVHLITLLAENKRLMVLPAIQVIFDILKSEQEKTLIADVITFSKLSDEQEKTLTESLSKRLQRTVSLKITVDPSVLGGALVQAGDLVIDGTVRGKLNKLKTEMAA